MSEDFDIAAARTWLDALPGRQMGERVQQRWQQFGEIDVPVVTVYGSYDTGKSSLIRRILIELGQAVPAWLTISARHETFEVNEIRAGGCLLRDTPGFVVDGTDARAQLNTERATEAVVLTDVAIVTVPPQLVTAELPALRQLLEQRWVPGSLWFVVSRFDEAGVDPEDDPEGYRELAVRKTRELRTALSLDDSIPVHIVCPDFAQMAGAERNPDPQVWNDSRNWDGIAGLVQAIAQLGASDGSALRRAAEERFWRRAVQQAHVELSEEVEKQLDNAVVSDEGEERRQSWLAQLDTVTRAGEADLRGRVSAVISDALDSPDPVQRFTTALKTSLGAWHAACERDIDKLLQSVGETIATERTRPDWQRFERLTAALHREPPEPDAEKDVPLRYAPLVGQVGDAVLDALRYYEKTSRGKKPPPATAPKFDRLQAAAAGVQLAAELASIAELFIKRQRDSDQAYAALQADVSAAGQEATELALDDLARLAGNARQRILDSTADQADLRESLHDMVGQLRELIASGQTLLRS
jgi:hypothetical protein